MCIKNMHTNQYSKIGYQAQISLSYYSQIHSSLSVHECHVNEHEHGEEREGGREEGKRRLREKETHH